MWLIQSGYVSARTVLLGLIGVVRVASTAVAAPPPNLLRCDPPSITPQKNQNGNFGEIRFSDKYYVELQDYFVCNENGVPYQAAIGQIPASGRLITIGEIDEISAENVSLKLGGGELRFSITKDTQICRDHKYSSLFDLKKGYVVTIISEESASEAIYIYGSPTGFNTNASPLGITVVGCD